jgi:nitrate/nitrite-specific signal transduction histidine kinase
VELCVNDNGKGFEAAQSFPGHLGLRSMHERVERYRRLTAFFQPAHQLDAIITNSSEHINVGKF